MTILLKLTKESNISALGNNEINIDLEYYLTGVVASEIGNAPIEACKAQAICARTFTLNRINSKGYISDDSSVDQALQASRLNNESYSNAIKGVQLTKGQILEYNGHMAQTYYCSSNGGIVNSKSKWNTPSIPYLKGGYKDEYDNGLGKSHGVGLSQVGAIARAKADFTCKDILDFYFPGTYIGGESNMTEQENKIVAWAKEHLGDGYVWGGTGQILTQGGLDNLISKYPNYVSQSKNGKWVGHRVWDCATFIAGALKQVGIKFCSGASSQYYKQSSKWAEQGSIEDMPTDRVCILYRATSPTVMQHTGIYLGDGTFIDDRGSSSGVIQSKLSSYKWTNYGIPYGLEGESQQKEEKIMVLFQAMVYASNGGAVRMRSQANSKAAILTSVPSGAAVDVLDDSNASWWKIQYNNTTGYMMTEFLKKGSEEEGGGYYVRIKCSSKTEADRLAEVLRACSAD